MTTEAPWSDGEAVDRVERERRIQQAIHSNLMSGLGVTPETREDAQEYVEGRISSRELRDRVHARYDVSRLDSNT